jgi:sulfur carrier protein
MSSFLTLILNGRARTLPELDAGATLQSLIDALGLKPDRIAVELDGDIVTRNAWSSRVVQQGCRIEIVHFVGGGAV